MRGGRTVSRQSVVYPPRRPRCPCAEGQRAPGAWTPVAGRSLWGDCAPSSARFQLEGEETGKKEGLLLLHLHTVFPKQQSFKSRGTLY